MRPSPLLRRLHDEGGKGGPEYAGAAAVLAIIVVALISSGLGEAIIAAILGAIGEGFRSGG